MSLYTIWNLRSVDGKQSIVTAKLYEPREVQHHYQQILGHVEAWNPKDALRSDLVQFPIELTDALLTDPAP